MKIFLYVIVLGLSIGCTDISESEKRTKLKYIGVVQGYKKYEMWVDGKHIADTYVDSAENLVEFSKSKVFKIAFQKNEVSYVSNKKSTTSGEVWIKKNQQEVIWRISKNDLIYETRLWNYMKPMVNHTVVKNNDGGKYLSAQQIFDFSTMDTIDNGFIQDVRSLNKHKVFLKGKKNIYSFQIISPYKSNKLIVSDFKTDFTHSKSVDTIDIQPLFDYELTSLQSEDTVRFVIYTFDSKSGLGSNIYYELPVTFE